MPSIVRPVSIVAILAVVAGSLWLRQRAEEDDGPLVRPPSRVVGTPAVISQQLLEQNRDRAMKGAPSGGRKTEAAMAQELRREADRAALAKLMTEASELAHRAEALALGKMPLTTEIRLTEVQKLVEGMARDSAFADIREAAAKGADAIKSRRTGPIDRAVAEGR